MHMPSSRIWHILLYAQDTSTSLRFCVGGASREGAAKTQRQADRDVDKVCQCIAHVRCVFVDDSRR